MTKKLLDIEKLKEDIYKETRDSVEGISCFSPINCDWYDLSLKGEKLEPYWVEIEIEE